MKTINITNQEKTRFWSNKVTCSGPGFTLKYSLSEVNAGFNEAHNSFLALG